MCDTLFAIHPGGALFGKNSDRPSREVQVLESFSRRSPGPSLRTQYLSLPDTGAAAVLGSRPEWLWGFEHGVNEHRVAIGNEKVFTTTNPNEEPAALIGMDLVRLGLERGATPDKALEAMTSLLAEHGQGGICDETTRESYYSSFLIAGPQSGWVLETSGRSWVAAPVEGTAAISNRLILTTEWTRGSADVAPGSDWDAFRHPNAPTGHADARLRASRACLSAEPSALAPADFAAHLRDHGEGPWGSPGVEDNRVSLPPDHFSPDGTGVTVCMHLRGFQNTTSSMICELPADPEAPLRAWVALGNPCCSVYVPVFPPNHAPPALTQPATWQRFVQLRDAVEASPELLPRIRETFAPLERKLWAEADGVAPNPNQHAAFVQRAWERLDQALDAATRAVGAAA
jgi:secernin